MTTVTLGLHGAKMGLDASEAASICRVATMTKKSIDEIEEDLDMAKELSQPVAASDPNTSAQ